MTLNTFRLEDGMETKHAPLVGVEVDFREGVAHYVSPVRGEPFLIPGLVDIHCHGYAGLDVMEGHTELLVARLRSLGVEWVFPTTVTSEYTSLRSALASVSDSSLAGFAGFHLEGPYLNPVRAGAQRVEAMRLPRVGELEEELGEHLEKVKIMTLAPELPGALDLVSHLAKQGITVSAGHTDARYEVLREAHGRGVRGMTHFYNAMRPLHHRELGCVGFGLIQPVYLEVIYDRVHVRREALELVYDVGGATRVIAVSDGTKLSGTAEGTEGHMWGFEVVHSEGAVRFKDGCFAGSAVTIRDVFQFLWEDFESARHFAVLACSWNSRRWLRLPEPRMWLVVDEDGEIEEIWDGELRFS